MDSTIVPQQRRRSRRRPLLIMVGSLIYMIDACHSLVRESRSTIDRPYSGRIAEPTRRKQYQLGAVNATSKNLDSLPVRGYGLEENSQPHRKRQIRRKPLHRRPKHYWLNATNLHQEIREFWTQQGIALPTHQAPPIPSEVLLMYCQRHDIRAAITRNGGRTVVSKILNDAPIVPGRWSLAMTRSPETLALVQRDPFLSVDRPPMVTRMTKSSKPTLDVSTKERWRHQLGRKPKGFWTLQILIREIYEYVDDYRRTHHRPAVWMPRPCEFTHNGRDDIRQAISRFGGASRISRVAGMVSYQEWFYFDGQLELFTELRRYLDENADGDYEVFPSATAVKKHGFDRLYGLIQYYGGRRFVAARLGMKIPASSSGSSNLDTASFHDQLNWGPFDLDFAVRLLLCIREGHIQRNPPLVNPTLSIPSAQRLRQSIHEEEDVWLEDKIQQYGGRENVARRLGLAFSSERKS